MTQKFKINLPQLLCTNLNSPQKVQDRTLEAENHFNFCLPKLLDTLSQAASAPFLTVLSSLSPPFDLPQGLEWSFEWRRPTATSITICRREYFSMQAPPQFNISHNAQVHRHWMPAKCKWLKVIIFAKDCLHANSTII